MNTGFSWVRIDKGNIHCNFRYMNLDQVSTVVNYLKSYYEYNNIVCSIVDLGAAGVLPESGDHYRPSGADPALDYYFLVELHRHGTIIPLGSIDVMKTAINGLAKHEIVPESVFIQRFQNNKLTVGDERTLTALSTKSVAGDVEWSSSDLTVISVTPDGMSCDIVAESPGTAQIEASVQVMEEVPLELKAVTDASAYWAGNIYKYVGPTTTYKIYRGKLMPPNSDHGDPFTFTQNNYYECVEDLLVETHYKWVLSDYDGSPVEVTYKDVYELFVNTYIKIVTKNIQRLCLYHYEYMDAETPSTGLTITWTSSTDCVVFDQDIATGDRVKIQGARVGNTLLSASLTDAYGTYVDSFMMTVYAIDVTPDTLKLVTGTTKHAVIHKKDIFSIDNAVVVDWVSNNTSIANVLGVNPTDTTLDFAEAEIIGMGVGQAIITAIAEDPLDGTSYSDSVKVTVGNVAITVPDSTSIYLLSADHTLELSCVLSPGFTVDASTGWVSGNPSVVEITTVSGTDNDTVLLTGLIEGSSIITVTARNGSAVDTDTIIINVVDAEYVTMGEMATFTHGMYNGHGVVDWNHPTGEEGTMEVPDGAVDTATEEEVDDFIDDLFTPENEEEPLSGSKSNKKKKSDD